MKVKIQFSISVILILLYQNTFSQVTTFGNTWASATDYLGWDVNAGCPPLNIKHEQALPINFYTNAGPGGFANQRMTIFDGPGTPANAGNVGIGTTTPTAVLHLNRGTAVPVITRYTNPNTVNGASNGFDVGVTDAGVGILRHLANQPIEVWTISLFNPRLNAAFTSNLTFENALATAGDGLRIYDPANNGGDLDLWTSTASVTNIKWGPNGSIRGINNRFEIQGEFANGLWFNVKNPAIRTFFNSQGVENARIGANAFWRIGPNPTNVDPSYTLDVNGHAAIRQVSAGSTLPHVLVVDDVTGSGEIQYRDISSFGNVTACGGGVTQDFITKWSATIPPTVCKSIIYEDVASRIGIGTGATTLFAKLHVNNTSEQIGDLVVTNRLTATTPNFSISTNCVGSDIGNIGVIATAKFSTNTLPNNLNNIGVWGNAKGNSLQNIGGLFVANDKTTCGTNYGVWGIAAHNCDFTQNGFAGFFTGNVEYTGTLNGVSDVKLKDSIQNINGALAILSRLQPKQFVFRTDSFPSMNLATGTHYGVIAQQIDTVLPQLVANVIQPQQIDSSGALLCDSIHFKGVNYMELIPFTIRAIQELDSLQNTKLTSCTGAAPPAANNLTKWDSASNVLCTSIIYDDGNRIGIPVVDANTYVNVLSHSGATTAKFTSDDSVNTRAVIKAEYAANGNVDTVIAVSGYSKYTGADNNDAGIGGRFIGGTYGAYGSADGANEIEVGVAGEAKGASEINAGVLGSAHDLTTTNNVGVAGLATGADNYNGGVLGISDYANSTSHNIGVIGMASSSGNLNYAGRFEAQDTVGTNYAVFGYAAGSSPRNYAGYFDGDVNVVGTLTTPSDLQLKNNVRSINTNDALSSISRLEPKTYTYRTQDYPYLSLPKGSQYGLVAQEVEQVLPQLVSDIIQPERRDWKGNVLSPKLEYKALNYTGIIPLLIGAIKQQQTKIDSLNKVIDTRLNGLEDRLNQCCRPQGSRKTDEGEGNTTTPPANENGAQVNYMSIELSSMQVIVLEQNVPNPFAEQTSISYFVPENMNNAQIIFTDMLGTVIKTADIKTGYGVMTVFASNLSTGQYSYTLLINGKVVETKKMVKSK